MYFFFSYVCIYIYVQCGWPATLDCCPCAILSEVIDLNSIRRVSWHIECDYSSCGKYNYVCLLACKQGRQVYAVDKVSQDDYTWACNINQCLKDGNTATCRACSVFKISVLMLAVSMLHFELLCCHRAKKWNMYSWTETTSLLPSGQPLTILPGMGHFTC